MQPETSGAQEHGSVFVTRAGSLDKGFWSWSLELGLVSAAALSLTVINGGAATHWSGSGSGGSSGCRGRRLRDLVVYELCRH